MDGAGAEEQPYDAQYDDAAAAAGGDEQQWEQWDDNQQWDAGYYDEGGEEGALQDQAIDVAFGQFFNDFMGSASGGAAPTSSSSFASSSAVRLPAHPLANQVAAGSATGDQPAFDANNDEPPPPEVPVKRKRGRPCKGDKPMPRHVKIKGAPKFKPTPPPRKQRSDPPAEPVDGAAPKRKRGRPFKGTMPPPVRPEPRERSTRIAIKAEEEEKQQQQQQLHRLGPYAAFKSMYLPDKRGFSRHPPQVTHATLPLHIRRALTSNTPWPATILPDEQDAPPRFPEIYSFVAWRKWKPKHDRRLRARLKGWERTGEGSGEGGEEGADGEGDREASTSAAGMSPDGDNDDGGSGRRSTSIATSSAIPAATDQPSPPPRPPAFHGPWLATISLENSLKIPFRVHPKHARQNYSGLLRLQWRARRTAAARAKAKASKESEGGNVSKRGRGLDLRDLWVRAVERELMAAEKKRVEGGGDEKSVEPVEGGDDSVDLGGLGGDMDGAKNEDGDASGEVVVARGNAAPGRRAPVFLRRNIRINQEREEELARAYSAQQATAVAV